ncbi:MAG: CHAD domain-containing protein [Actinomycetota bacterium]|nr:CHAD domain-containing protein [Actinomycetota bacterium]
MKERHFRADDDSLQGYLALAENQFELERESTQDSRLALYDTFDWRLYRKGFFACAVPGSFLVRKAFAASPHLECEMEVIPKTWDRFENERLRSFMKDILGDRALLPLLDFEVREENFAARNEDHKIICRLSTLTPASDGGRPYLLIKPLKGYARESEPLYALAAESAMEELRTSILEELLRAQGIHPGEYSSKLDVRLDKGQTITEAALVILHHLLSTMKINIPGIIADYDTEFLHDFRVASRRTRACLSQLKEALPRDAAKKYNKDFKNIAQRCNVLRDLDVFLLEKQRYYDLLPQHLHRGLDSYFAHVRRDRKSRQKKFTAFLQGEDFKSILDDWEGFLAHPETPGGSDPAIAVARKRIYGRFRKIINEGRKITDASPDRDLHTLRIECKKLRYLLEFSKSLFPAAKMKKLVQHLKDFQDNLGEFNDLTMQQINLKEYLERSSGEPRRNQLESAAIGGLLAALHNRQIEVREEFCQRFADFDSKEIHSLYEELFKRGKGRAS